MMTSDLNLIISSQGKSLSDIMRDVKRHTAEALHQSIIKHPQESRREWLLWMMERAGKKHNTSFQL
jgi:putative transposase